MLIKIMKPVPGMAYFGGEVVDLDPKKIAKWVESGHMVITPETEGDDNTLPADLPGREALYKAGHKTLDEVKTIKESLTEVPGIGKATAAGIIKFLEA